MKKIAILVLHLGYGGIERAVTTLANMLITNYEIEIISTYKIYEEPPFFIDKRIKIRYLINDKPNRDLFLKALFSLKLIKILKEGLKSLKILYLKRITTIKAIRELKSDLIITTRPLHNSWAGKYGNNISLKIAWEHSHHNNDVFYIRKLINSCKKIDHLVLVSKELANFYSSKLIFSKTKCRYIPLALSDIPSHSSSLTENNLISIGRLSKEKGFLDLIDVFKLVHIKYPKWKLHIIGDGREKAKIAAKIKNLNLSKSVFIHGFLKPEMLNKWLLKSSIYLMTSFYESFGLVLIEAMSHGIPCIAFSSAKGPLAIIDNHVNGYLIENRNKQIMADKIMFLIANKDKRKILGNQARKKALKHNASFIKKEWLSLIN